MNVKVKYDYQVKRNQELAMRVSELEQENEALKAKINSLSQSNLEAQLEEVERLRQQYVEVLSGLGEIQEKYREAIRQAHKTKYKFAKKAQRAINKIKTR